MNPVLTLFRRTSRGFTLTETLIAVTIMGFATVGIVAFMRQGVRLYYADRARLMINRDIRAFTSQMDTDGVESNFYRIYPSFTTTSTGTGSATADAAVSDGQVGDYLVLVFTDPASTSKGISMITKLVGYYREVTNTTLNTGPVHRFSIDLSSSPVNAASAPMYTILANAVTGSASSYPIVTQLAQGLATNATGATATPALFYNLKNRSIMINAQITESLTELGNVTQTGNTYNFAVSPRG
jgi:prepilin-type N-terminal cleavage/methylation domain-containing protein